MEGLTSSVSTQGTIRAHVEASDLILAKHGEYEDLRRGLLCLPAPGTDTVFRSSGPDQGTRAAWP